MTIWERKEKKNQGRKEHIREIHTQTHAHPYIYVHTQSHVAQQISFGSTFCGELRGGGHVEIQWGQSGGHQAGWENKKKTCMNNLSQSEYSRMK